MKIVCVYTRVTGPGKIERYSAPAERFLKTYLQQKPRIEHELIVMRNEINQSDMFRGVATGYIDYFGGGWDCGSWHFAADAFDCDLVVCLNAFTNFHRQDWLDKFVEAFEKFGPGVYGTRGSYEWNVHLGTPCIAFTPRLVRGYPHRSYDRHTAGLWEAGIDNFTVWAMRSGLIVKQVTGHGVHGPDEWRMNRLTDIFRRGSQGQMLVFDRHTDVYSAADATFKQYLAASADTRRAPRINP